MDVVNENSLPIPIAIKRIHDLDITASILPIWRPTEDGNTIQLFIIQTSIDETTIRSALSNALTTNETTLLQNWNSAVADFNSLPNWSTWTSDQATSYIVSNILNGWEQAQIDNYIDTNVTSLAGARAAFKQIGGALVTMRNILSIMAKTVIYIRNFVIKIR